MNLPMVDFQPAKQAFRRVFVEKVGRRQNKRNDGEGGEKEVFSSSLPLPLSFLFFALAQYFAPTLRSNS